MRANSRKFCLLLLFALFVSQAFCQDLGRIEGEVTDAVTGRGVPGVSVHLTSDQGSAGEATTDAAGRFRLSDLKPGQYAASFERPGYMWFYIGSGSGQVRPLKVGPGETVKDIRVPLNAYASLEGRVLDPDGNPFAGAEVQLENGTTISDKEGRYHFPEIVPHSYHLLAVPPLRLSKEGSDRTEITRTWYPSVTEKDQAQEIAVRAGDKLTGIDLKLVSVRVYRIRGTVVGPDGKPQDGSVVRITTLAESPILFFRNSGSAAKKGAARSEPFASGPLGYFVVAQNPTLPHKAIEAKTQKGVFEFQAVPRGSRLLVTSVDGGGGPSGASVFPLVVDRDLDDLRIQIDSPVTVDAQVDIAATATIDPALLSQVSLNLAGRNAVAQADGSIHLSNIVPGPYQIVASPALSGGYYLAGITLGGREVTGQTINLAAGSPPIHLMYKADGANVYGTLKNGKQAILIPTESLAANRVRMARMSTASAEGRFEFGSVAPGSYYGFATDNVAPTAVLEPAGVAKIRASALSVRVDAGSTISVELPEIKFDQ